MCLRLSYSFMAYSLRLASKLYKSKKKNIKLFKGLFVSYVQLAFKLHRRAVSIIRYLLYWYGGISNDRVRSCHFGRVLLYSIIEEV